MLQRLGPGVILLLAGFTAMAQAAPVTFAAKDGVVVHGDWQAPKGPSRGTLLLFHMAGSNAGEYAPIAPRLVQAGFTTLAIDQRSGGTLWGQTNATARSVHSSPSYQQALPDLGAALDYAKGHGSAPVIAWGSSYSAALVFVLASRHPEIKAVLAFSPGEYIPGLSIAGAASQLKVPVFVTSAADEDEIATARTIARAVPDGRGHQYIPTHGVHGSATLRADRNPQGSADNMRAVMAFLDIVAPQGR